MFGEEVPEEIMYAVKKLLDTGLDFRKIPHEDLMVTCNNYNGIISKANHARVIDAINRIYLGIYGNI